ncbi:MAG: hypothetical protein ACE37D_18950, partial [Pseudomonadales bacterium]
GDTDLLAYFIEHGASDTARAAALQGLLHTAQDQTAFTSLSSIPKELNGVHVAQYIIEAELFDSLIALLEQGLIEPDSMVDERHNIATYIAQSYSDRVTARDHARRKEAEQYADLIKELREIGVPLKTRKERVEKIIEKLKPWKNTNHWYEDDMRNTWRSVYRP